MKNNLSGTEVGGGTSETAHCYLGTLDVTVQGAWELTGQGRNGWLERDFEVQPKCLCDTEGEGEMYEKLRVTPVSRGQASGQ